jgi:flagellar motor component MotA
MLVIAGLTAAIACVVTGAITEDGAISVFAGLFVFVMMCCAISGTPESKEQTKIEVGCPSYTVEIKE